MYVILDIILSILSYIYICTLQSCSQLGIFFSSQWQTISFHNISLVPQDRCEHAHENKSKERKGEREWHSRREKEREREEVAFDICTYMYSICIYTQGSREDALTCEIVRTSSPLC